MINIKPDQLAIMDKYNIDCNRYIDDVLLDLDAKITEIGFDSDYELTEEGLMLQLLYDQLFNQN